jgi:hypothetical protein
MMRSHALAKWSRQHHFTIRQIKEKYATLRIEISGGPNADIDAIVGQAESISEMTCEKCGLFGLLWGSNQRFITLCFNCAADIKKHHGDVGRFFYERTN